MKLCSDTATVACPILTEIAGNVPTSVARSAMSAGVVIALMVLYKVVLAGGVTVLPLDKYGATVAVCVTVEVTVVGTTKTVRAEL